MFCPITRKSDPLVTCEFTLCGIVLVSQTVLFCLYNSDSLSNSCIASGISMGYVEVLKDIPCKQGQRTVSEMMYFSQHCLTGRKFLAA